AGQTLSDYMGGDQAQWDKVQTWIEAEYGEGKTPTPTTPAPTAEPTAAPTATPTATPTVTPTTAPTAPATQFKNAEFASFTANGITAKYHLYAEGLDHSKPIGLLVYGDGSAEYGLENPKSPYLLAGNVGLRETAKKHNMVLLTPMAPGTNCTDGDGDCWYGNS